ncbi:hypothetical protein EV652_108247 [Kribbella steppae]|uniref:Uncharacterized protein n=1 Tax=Kribbella steppae TaxID=2512223 RepID=A0A4R2HBK4_9ACTN|nr:hypothetical protein EV652_108247 [Kribbella steppae]
MGCTAPNEAPGSAARHRKSGQAHPPAQGAVPSLSRPTHAARPGAGVSECRRASKGDLAHWAEPGSRADLPPRCWKAKLQGADLASVRPFGCPRVPSPIPSARPASAAPSCDGREPAARYVPVRRRVPRAPWLRGTSGVVWCPARGAARELLSDAASCCLVRGTKCRMARSGRCRMPASVSSTKEAHRLNRDRHEERRPVADGDRAGGIRFVGSWRVVQPRRDLGVVRSSGWACGTGPH